MIETKAQAEATSDAERIRALEKKTQSCANNEIIVRKAAKYFAEETHW
nr:hypothetical protein [Corynebacterium belfantii]